MINRPDKLLKNSIFSPHFFHLRNNTLHLVRSFLLRNRTDSSVVQCVQKFWSDYLNLVNFEVFGVKLSAKKSIFQNCLSGSPLGLVLWGNFQKSIFGRKFHSKNLKIDQISEPDKNFFNALYFTKEMRLVDAVLSGISAALFGVVIWAIFTDNRERVLMRELPQRRIVFQLLVCLGVLNFMFVFAQHIQRGLQTGDNKKKTVESLKISGKF